MRFILLMCSLLLTACTAGSGPADREAVSTATPPTTVTTPALVDAPIVATPVTPADLTQQVEDLIPVAPLPATTPATPIVVPAPSAPTSADQGAVNTDKMPETAPTAEVKSGQ